MKGCGSMPEGFCTGHEQTDLPYRATGLQSQFDTTVSFWPHFPAGDTFLVNHICGRVNFTGQPIFKLFNHVEWAGNTDKYACENRKYF